jgi:hypothetical protein
MTDRFSVQSVVERPRVEQPLSVRSGRRHHEACFAAVAAVANATRTHADRHQAVAGLGDRGTHEGRLYEYSRCRPATDPQLSIAYKVRRRESGRLSGQFIAVGQPDLCRGSNRHGLQFEVADPLKRPFAGSRRTEDTYLGGKPST